MAKLVLRDCFIEVNGTNFSTHTSSCTINLSKDEIDTTNFSGSGRERAHGLKDDSFEITFHQDFAATKVDSVLFPLWDLETEFLVKVRPTSAAKSASNPEYTGTCILLEYTPLAGDVGDLSTTDVTFPAQRSGIARATS
jgi:hypothetical protein